MFRLCVSSLPEPCLWGSNKKICPKSEANITQSWLGLCSERPEQGSSLFQGKLKFFPKPTPSHQVACSWEECKAAHLRVCEAYANSGRSEAYAAFFTLYLMLAQPLPCGQAAWRSLVGLQGAGQTWGGCSNKISKNTILLQVEDLESRGGLLYRQAGSPESAAQMLVNDFHVRMKYYLNMTLRSNKYLEKK